MTSHGKKTPPAVQQILRRVVDSFHLLSQFSSSLSKVMKNY